MLQSGLTEQLVEADILLFIKPERVLMTRRWGLLSGLVGQFSVCIHNIGKKGGATWERPRPRRARTFVGQTAVCRTKVHLAVVWRQQKSAPENLSPKFSEFPEAAFEVGSFPCAILQPSGAEKKPAERTGAVVSGH